MEDSPWWARSPVFIVPLCIFAVCLAFLPFAVADTDHAAQFYGSFVAAIVAAGAVVGTTTLQARFARRQREDERRSELRAVAVEASIYLAMAHFEIDRVRKRLAGLIEMRRVTLINPPPGPNNSTWRILVSRAATPLPARIVENAGRMNRAAAQTIIEYSRLAQVTRENIAYEELYPSGSPIDTDRAKELVGILDGCGGAAAAAAAALDEFERDIAK